MNATPTNLTPGNAVQAASRAGKQADSSAPDVPFSQVLSGEIAQNRKNDAAKESSDASAKPDPASQAASPADGKTDSAQPAKTDKDTPHEHRATAPSEDAAVAPETLLALPISPDAFRPAAVAPGTGLAATEPATAHGDAAMPNLGASSAPGLEARKGGAIPVMPDGQHAREAHGTRGTQKADPGLSGKEDPQVAGAATRTSPPAAGSAPSPAPAPASTFVDQLAAARQADATKTGDSLLDLMSNPLVRAAPHAPVDTLLAAADAAAPRLAPTVGTAAWGQALGDKLVWMAAGTQQTASLTLNPPNLGPLQIVLHVTNDQATASFFSAQPEVRHALEAAFPRLREMMNDAGIQLGQATVSADTPQQQNDTPDRQAQRIVPPFPGADAGAPAGLQAVQAPIRQSGRGLVDTFA